MADIGLGDIERFPFVEPPDARSIADGIALLEELGAIRPARDDGAVRLTARAPAGPAAGRPPARPHGARGRPPRLRARGARHRRRPRPSSIRASAHRAGAARAAELHRRFDDPDSDFLAYLNLWAYLRELRQRAVLERSSASACTAEHLNWLRVREWEDVHSQLRQIAGGLGIHAGAAPSRPRPTPSTRPLLAGLLSHIGNWDEERAEYLGARQARFAIGRSSSLGRAKTRPKWVVAAELVETNRLWGRTVARIQPGVDRAGRRRRRQADHGEPWWDEERGAAMVEERVSVFGLEVARRRVEPGPLRRGPGPGAVHLPRPRAGRVGVPSATDVRRARTRRPSPSIEALEAKARRRDVLVDHDAMCDLYDARLPDAVTSGAAFDRWWRDHRLADPDLLRFSTEELVDPEAGEVSERRLPGHVDLGRPRARPALPVRARRPARRRGGRHPRRRAQPLRAGGPRLAGARATARSW